MADARVVANVDVRTDERMENRIPISRLPEAGATISINYNSLLSVDPAFCESYTCKILSLEADN